MDKQEFICQYVLGRTSVARGPESAAEAEEAWNIAHGDHVPPSERKPSERKPPTAKLVVESVDELLRLLGKHFASPCRTIWIVGEKVVLMCEENTVENGIPTTHLTLNQGGLLPGVIDCSKILDKDYATLEQRVRDLQATEKSLTKRLLELQIQTSGDRNTVNAQYLVNCINAIHDALCPGHVGTWQERAEQCVTAAKSAVKSAAGEVQFRKEMSDKFDSLTESLNDIHKVLFDGAEPMVGTAWKAVASKCLERLISLQVGWRVGTTTGARFISEERQRQVLAEHFSAEHDDEHREFQLSQAAMCYANVASMPDASHAAVESRWPWQDVHWKPSKDPVKNLVKAGALIAAEIDRLRRIPTSVDVATN